MFFRAAKTLSDLVSQEDLDQGRIYPPLSKIREVSLKIAEAVAEVAYEKGLASKPKPENIGEYLKSLMYEPEYQAYI
jgi:malate dehydrogenase (oxaloacetate-decarboxylating)(NADP+)